MLFFGYDMDYTDHNLYPFCFVAVAELLKPFYASGSVRIEIAAVESRYLYRNELALHWNQWKLFDKDGNESTQESQHTLTLSSLGHFVPLTAWESTFTPFP